MRLTSFGAVPSQKAAMGAAGNEGDEHANLLNLTRTELLALYRQISDALARLPEDAPQRSNGRATLRNIRWILDRRGHDTGLMRRAPRPTALPPPARRRLWMHDAASRATPVSRE
jgi:hypothetical protein